MRIAFVLGAQRFMSAITTHIIHDMFDERGVRTLSLGMVTYCTIFYQLMDETANVMKENLLASLPPPSSSTSSSSSSLSLPLNT